MRLRSGSLATVLVLVAVAAFAAIGCDSNDGGPDNTLPDVPDNGGDPGSDPGTDPGPVPDVPEVLDEVCTPDCTGKACGPDGCGGTCATCPPGCDGTTPQECVEGACVVPCCPDCTGKVCGPDGCEGTCEPGCTGETTCNLKGECAPNCVWEEDKPTSWGPAAVISALQTPSDATVVQATCFDYTNDGKGDNGLKGLAGQVNGPLADAVNGGDIAILFELAGVADFVTAASFQLNGLLGVSTATPPATTGDFWVGEDAYVKTTCDPMIYFEGAKIEAGVLTAGPSEFRLSIPIQEDLVIDATLIQAQIKGTVTNGDAATGFEVEGGVLSGVLTKQQLEAAVDALQVTCDAAPANDKPSYCSYLTVVRSAMALLFDLHQNGDGTFSPKSKELPGDAASVCLAFTMSKAKVVGFEPAPVP